MAEENQGRTELPWGSWSSGTLLWKSGAFVVVGYEGLFGPTEVCLFDAERMVSRCADERIWRSRYRASVVAFARTGLHRVLWAVEDDADKRTEVLAVLDHLPDPPPPALPPKPLAGEARPVNYPPVELPSIGEVWLRAVEWRKRNREVR